MVPAGLKGPAPEGTASELLRTRPGAWKGQGPLLQAHVGSLVGTATCDARRRPSPIPPPRTYRQCTRKTSVTYRQHNPRGPPGVPLRGEPAGTAMKGQGARGGSGHSEGRTLRHSGRTAKPRGQQGRGSPHRTRCNDGKDQSRGSRQPHPGQRKTPGQDGPSPVSLTPGPLAREWWGGCCRARPSPGPVWLCPAGAGSHGGPGGPLNRGSRAQSGGCRGVGNHLAWGRSGGWPGTLTTRAVPTASQSGGSATMAIPTSAPRRGAPRVCMWGAPTSQEFYSHSTSSRAGSDEAVGRWGLKSPGVESRGSGQRIQRVQTASPPPPPTEAGRGHETPPTLRLAEPASHPRWRCWLCVRSRW